MTDPQEDRSSCRWLPTIKCALWLEGFTYFLEMEGYRGGGWKSIRIAVTLERILEVTTFLVIIL